MARYFFRADYPGISINDDGGEEFSTLQDVEAHVTIGANTLIRPSSQGAPCPSSVRTEYAGESSGTFLIGFPRGVPAIRADRSTTGAASL
jgi:hypothetical protein